jgi:hypothetical protein
MFRVFLWFEFRSLRLFAFIQFLLIMEGMLCYFGEELKIHHWYFIELDFSRNLRAEWIPLFEKLTLRRLARPHFIEYAASANNNLIRNQLEFIPRIDTAEANRADVGVGDMSL